MVAESSTLLKPAACGVLVALALVAAGAILDMKAAQEDSLKLVMMAVRQDGRALKFAGDDFQDNKAVVLAAVQQIGSAVKFASEGLRGDKEVALRAARNNQADGKVLAHLLEPVKNDLEVQLAAVRNNPSELQKAPLVDRSTVLDAVRVRGTTLKFAKESLRMDREVVLEAVRRQGEALKLVPPTSELLKDREVVLEAVRHSSSGHHADVLRYVSKASKNFNPNEDLTKDREVVLAAVRHDGDALLFASPQLREDPEVVMAAVVNRGTALKHAKGKVEKEAEFAAVFRDNRAILSASQEFKADYTTIVSDAAGNWQGSPQTPAPPLPKIRLPAPKRDAVQAIVKAPLPKDASLAKKPGFQEEIDEVMRILGEDYPQREAVKYKMELTAVRYDGLTLKSLSHLKENREVVDTAVRHNGLALQHVGPKLQEDPQVVLAAVHQNGMALEMSKLTDNREVVLAAVLQDGTALKHARSFCNDREVVLAAVRQNGKALEWADDALKADRDVVLAAVRNDVPIPVPKPSLFGFQRRADEHSQALRHADVKLRKDRDVVLEALRSNGRALEFVQVNEITTTWESTITAGMTVLVLGIAVVVLLVFTPLQASSHTAGPSE